MTSHLLGPSDDKEFYMKRKMGPYQRDFSPYENNGG